ncbi:N-acetylmuramoyl-L-alanine amidase [Streptomyces iconiensis]|uniref:N-acetylmuramoyl-L-alanine amidase n=1 Tax=Streptomyces iconiensis TaxID=1384038 RepID=A0ABT7AAA9_9ACTN|nr:N-acetylmuramoyl-L-alanine amidase [Streptomyces iconiensis]MDJ1137934.1 N-acetylmuramoyl-L-alanine amidase [Streptomyces iconiensis]
MATPLTAAKFLAALKAEGIAVVEHDGWRTHTRTAKSRPWGPVHGVMLHHTGPGTEKGLIDLCRRGRADLPGPLVPGVITKSGTVHLVGYGRCNHAGSGDDDVLRAVIAESALPRPNEQTTDGNARFYGFEAINKGDGKDPWPDAQRDAMVRVSAALLRAHAWGGDGKTSVIAHKEWTNQKPDPRTSPGGADVSMAAIRALVAERLTHPAAWSPGGATHTVVPGETLSSIARDHGTAWLKLAQLNGLKTPYRIYPGNTIKLK